MVLHYNYQLIDRQIDYSAAEDYIRSHYVHLTLLTVNDSLLRTLNQIEVITLDEKMTVKKMDTGERMEHLLDHVITPSLKAKHREKYINFIDALDCSDDLPSKELASLLRRHTIKGTK